MEKGGQIKFHPETLTLIKILERSNVPPINKMSVADARMATEKSAELFGGSYDYNGTQTEIFVPSPQVVGGIPIYVYKPINLGVNPTILIYFHGGGFTVGSRDDVDTMCKIHSDRAKCLVVSVEYRLAPEYKYPAALEDGLCVTRWVLNNKGKVGGTNASRVGISGDSAGAWIATSVCHDTPGLAFQILIYGRVLPAGEHSLPAYKQFKDGPVLTQELLEWFENHYFGAEMNKSDAETAIFFKPKFDQLPPTLLIAAECDPLRDDTYLHSGKLTAAGVRNELFLVKGAPHAFFTWPGLFKECCEAAYAKTVDFIKRQRAPSSAL